jgi:hypothetical protein
MVAIVFMWTKHITANWANLLLETGRKTVAEAVFHRVREFKTVTKFLGRTLHKLQVAEFTMLNQRPGRRGEL